MLPLKQRIVYGPVSSRRLGRSLGVNILPPGRKTCTFNCVYCQYGWTPWIPFDEMMDASWPSVEEIETELDAALSSLTEPIDFITLSGNGEPTLHPAFGQVVDGLVRLRGRLAPTAKTAVLSNASTLPKESVISAIGRLDVRAMKLDAGCPRVFGSYNRPIIDISFNTLIHSLKKISGLTIQALFSDGEGGNTQPENLRDWFNLIAAVHPVHVQVYTLHRPYPSWQIAPMERNGLLAIRDRVRNLGVDAEAY